MDIYLNEVVYYLATQSWQIAVLTVAVAAASFALRRHSAHVRYLLWLIVLAKCLVPPVYVVPLQVLPQTVPRVLPVPSQTPEGLATPSGIARPIPRAVSRPPSAEPVTLLQDLQVRERRLVRRLPRHLAAGRAPALQRRNILLFWQAFWLRPQAALRYFGGSDPRKDGCAIGY